MKTYFAISFCIILGLQFTEADNAISQNTHKGSGTDSAAIGFGGGGITKVSSSPVIDGNLDEETWQSATRFTGFRTFSPNPGNEPSEKTTVLITYDDENLFFAVRGFDSEPERIKTSVAQRDNIDSDDWISIELDTYNNAQSNIFFRVNPSGIQADGYLNPFNYKADYSLDLVWYSHGVIDDEGYTVEVKIPFTSLRFNQKENTVFKFGVRRQIGRYSEISVFPEYLPRNGSMFVQRKEIILSDVSFKTPVEIIPAVTQFRSYVNKASWEKSADRSDVSLTGKIGLTSALTLDATINPDFSHVESDAGVQDVNLRHAVFYPEKRPFFLEGLENLGFATDLNRFWTPVKTFINTRTIVDPSFGVKLNGKISDRNMLSGIYALDEFNGDHSRGSNTHIAVGRMKRELSRDGYIGGIYTGRESGGYFNRVAGSDGRIRISDRSKIEYHGMLSRTRSAGPEGVVKTGSSLGIQYHYETRKLTFYAGAHDVSKDFQTDTGLMRRTGISFIPTYTKYSFYPQSGLIKRFSLEHYSQLSVDKPTGKFENSFNWFGFVMDMPLQTWMYFGGSFRDEFYGGTKYDRDYLDAGIRSQVNKRFHMFIKYEIGKEINFDISNPYQGYKKIVQTDITLQLSDNLKSVINMFDYKFFRDADDEKIIDYRIVRSHNSFQFNKSLFLRGIAEYNSLYRKIDVSFLLSFTSIPGTVMQIGYGSMYKKMQWRENEFVSAKNYSLTDKNVFVKASYLLKR